MTRRPHDQGKARTASPNPGPINAGEPHTTKTVACDDDVGGDNGRPCPTRLSAPPPFLIPPTYSSSSPRGVGHLGAGAGVRAAT